jgi:hypothetical protein
MHAPAQAAVAKAQANFDALLFREQLKAAGERDRAVSDALKAERAQTTREKAELERAATLAISTAMQTAAEAEAEAEKKVAAAEARAESHALALKRAAVVARVEAARRDQEDGVDGYEALAERGE